MPTSRLKHLFASIWETAEVVIIALVTVFVIRAFIAQPFLVSGASMQATFQDGNYLLIDELTYDFRPPARGEVIVFKYPNDPKEYFIKRIIGLPGETLTVGGNQITISPPAGSPITLREPYLGTTTKTFGEKTVTLGQDEYFVMGDNRSNSFDSRNWGPLSRKAIIGIARLRLFPLGEAGVVRAPQY